MKENMKVAFITLGCKVNIAETEGMKLLFKNAGYEIVDENEFADIYVVNTCTVTGMGDKKSRQMLRRANSLNPKAIVAAVGCFAQVSPEEAAKIQGVNLVLGNNLKHKIVEFVEQASAKGKKSFVMERKNLNEYEELPVETYEGHTRAFLKIQDGCNQFCSYCIIPYARGPIRSRGINEVVKEARGFAERGFKEVVLTGIHLTSFGDTTGEEGLGRLIKEVHSIDGIERIRLGSLEPMFITAEFIDEIKGLPKLCPHFHLSLQSGCEQTLKRMNRKYTPEDYRSIVSQLRANIPDVIFTTDVMVGFPGETEDEFNQSYDFCKDMGFLWMHVFKYSPRKGTPAARFPEQVQSAIKEERSKKMISLANTMKNQLTDKYIGRQMDVLLEKEVDAAKGLLEGLTSNYLSVYVNADSGRIGDLVNVKLYSMGIGPDGIILGGQIHNGKT